ncbi:MAG: tryptophan synthase subunit beta [Candidatus Altiarchaeales archaeon]|nr:tryptophan synthase subunit beta [Candidatus Altiarchaeales archaeon]MBD3415941.1 tryptophan synthase subunit beta [Candidatus Altiarchaeales archaeon]
MPVGKFGQYGGQFVPETLMPALEELEKAYKKHMKDKGFKNDLAHLLSDFAGRPTPLYLAGNLSDEYGVRIYLKREDLVHGGAHKLNNTLGQVLLAQRMGKPRVIAETGAGQHGVATAISCAALGLDCEVHMGTEDMERQKLNVFRMGLLGARVIPATSGSCTLKDATNEALRDWLANVEETYYCIGSVVGPHPYPTIVRDFQRVIGRETRRQVLKLEGRLPDAIVACVGGGSNALGSFTDFIKDGGVRLVGVEAGGKGVNTRDHGATLGKGSDGVFHGMHTKLLQDRYGQIQTSYSISAGLDYPGVGPQLSDLAASGRLETAHATDRQAIEAVKVLCEKEGILPALESAHAVSHALKMAGEMKEGVIVITVSGRGDKDVHTIADALGVEL